MKILDAVFVYHLVEHERVAWHGRFHSHGCDEYEMHFFLDGDGTLLCGKTRYSIAPEKFFIIAPGEFHSIIPDMTARPITYYAILFSPSETDADLLCLLKEVFEKRAQGLSISSTNRLQCDDMTKLFKSGDGAFIKSAEYALQSMLFRVYRQCGLYRIGGGPEQIFPQGLARQSSGHTHVKRALHIMQKNARKNLCVDEVARLLALSTEHFIRVFRTEIKLTPYQYMIRLKIEGASGLLISTTKTVGEIADWFGFENQFHFSRCFKKCTGVSPLEYRKIYLQAADLAGAVSA
ncbi:MAG: helix-turn-helix domain-containing protein [Spirochaetaceae bacterium]|jgi:AraC-like DNA-binding protein|nr:helix-turn-helix domain-containing protein [Spirochaetaceae bacterium]